MTDYESKRVLVAGAGGFIGGHLAGALKALGCAHVRCVDIKPRDEWFQVHEGTEVVVGDLSQREVAERACDGVDEVFNLAADMGGMGFIENNKALCMLSVLINTNLLVAARDSGVARYFFASSACVYNAEKQRESDNPGLREADAYPALPEDGYGWEKLFSERMCRHFREDFGLETRVARFHNVFGPHGTFDGGREKAPAAICRKVFEGKQGSGQIEIWGDGTQSRSFMYIDDCIEGILRIHESDCTEPLNLGSDELVTINQLVDFVEDIAGVELQRSYATDAPRGVQGRNSDNTRIVEVLGWAPLIPLKAGLRETYAWITRELQARVAPALPQDSSECRDSSSSTSATGRTTPAPDSI